MHSVPFQSKSNQSRKLINMFNNSIEVLKQIVPNILNQLALRNHINSIVSSSCNMRV